MTINEATIDRVLRAVVGAVLLTLSLITGMVLFSNPVLYWGTLIVGAIVLLTATAGFWPAFCVPGIRTCRQ